MIGERGDFRMQVDLRFREGLSDAEVAELGKACLSALSVRVEGGCFSVVPGDGRPDDELLLSFLEAEVKRSYRDPRVATVYLKFPDYGASPSMEVATDLDIEDADELRCSVDLGGNVLEKVQGAFFTVVNDLGYYDLYISREAVAAGNRELEAARDSVEEREP